jgi:hypothetical protein
MIRDDIEHASRSGDLKRTAMLRLCLRHFLRDHPGRGPDGC